MDPKISFRALVVSHLWSEILCREIKIVFLAAIL